MANPAATHLLYLHGFRSSPRSAKARRMQRHVAEHHPGVTFWCPQLPPSPRAAWPPEAMAVVGSSLGGFYATWVAARTGCLAALLNPAVDPARDLAGYIGQQTLWHAPDEAFHFRAEYVDELRALAAQTACDPAQVLAVIATGDEVLDWHEMAARHAGATLRIVQGGDHALSDFDPHLGPICAFLGLV
jgi:predicted esterase YcpF (UPF0227 family)